MTAQEIYNIVPDKNGWRKLPSGVFVKLGNGVELGDRVTLGNDVTSLTLAQQYRDNYISAATEHVFVKWVTKERKSPGWGNASIVSYSQGSTVEANGVANDQQCAAGLHVFRLGERPEWHGLCQADHDLIPLRVRVKSEDILFAGLPTMDAKLRVRKLEVID